VSKLVKRLGNPTRSPICVRIGWPAVTPTAAKAPGRRRLPAVSVEPDAKSPSPANERRRMPASALKFERM
jgi:hypothetical protein